MQSLNKVMLIGNCAAKPELKTTTTGAKVARLRVATNRSWKDDDGEHKATEWHTVIAWDRLGETCAEYIDKGKPVFVEGRLRTNSWKTEAGEDRSTKEIIATRVSFLDSRRAEETEGVPAF